jgi:hypothetical protein
MEQMSLQMGGLRQAAHVQFNRTDLESNVTHLTLPSSFSLIFTHTT